MAVSYNKLWKLMIDKGMNKTQLRLLSHISTNAMTKLSKNESVQVDILEKICSALNCESGDIIEITPDNRANSEGN